MFDSFPVGFEVIFMKKHFAYLYILLMMRKEADQVKINSISFVGDPRSHHVAGSRS